LVTLKRLDQSQLLRRAYSRVTKTESARTASESGDSGANMKSQTVIVHFGENSEFNYSFADSDVSLSRKAARAWFDEQFLALECDVASPIGKVLSADRLLSVAKYAGAKRFRDDPQWATTYAKGAVALMGVDFLKVDIPNYSIGY
jgi:hypothetical protein